MNNYVCSVCGHEQDSMHRKCDACGSIKIVTIQFAEDNFGPNWRDCFKGLTRLDIVTDIKNELRALEGSCPDLKSSLLNKETFLKPFLEIKLNTNKINFNDNIKVDCPICEFEKDAKLK